MSIRSWWTRQRTAKWTIFWAGKNWRVGSYNIGDCKIYKIGPMRIFKDRADATRGMKDWIESRRNS